MWCPTICLGLLMSIFPSVTLGLDQNTLKFGIEYFKNRDVKFVCLLTCGNDVSWTFQFSKLSSNVMMAVSGASIDDSMTNFNRVENCLRRRLYPVGVIIDAECGKSEDVLYFTLHVDIDLYQPVSCFSVPWVTHGPHQEAEIRVFSVNVQLMSDGKSNQIKYVYLQENTYKLQGKILYFKTQYRKGYPILLPEGANPLSIRIEIYVNAIKKASENMWLDSSHKWLLINDDEAETENYNDTKINAITFDKDGNRTVINKLDNLNISVDADIVVALRDYSSYTLYDVYNYGKIQGGNLIVHKVGSWDVNNGLNLDVNLNGYKYYRRWDFQNITMRMILVVQPAPKHFDPESLAGVQPVPGVAMITQTNAAVLYVVAGMHNIKYVPTITDRWIGTYERNSSKVVSNTLYFREQDISPVIRLLKSVQEHNDVLNTPLTAIETRYYYRIPIVGPGKFENQFLRPLSPTAWWSVIAVSALCSALLLLSALLEQRPSSVQYAVFSVVASICQQFFEDINDGGAKTTSTARKITILVTGLSCVLLYNYYTSSVVSWLLNGPPPSINTLKELLESPLELIYEDIGYTRSWLQTPSYYYNKRNALIEDELRKKKVFNKKKDAPLLVNLVEGIKMVQRGGYAYHTEVNSANALISKTFTQDELCELGSLQSMEKTLLYPVLQKHSPFKEFMNWSLMRLSEQGIVSCIQVRTSSFEVKCEGSSPRALALGGAAPAFILLAGGYIMATIIMLIERMVYKMKPSHDIPK